MQSNCFGSTNLPCSDQGLVLVALKGVPPTREELVDTLKAAIAGGRYDLDQALDGAIDALAEDLSRS